MKINYYLCGEVCGRTGGGYYWIYVPGCRHFFTIPPLLPMSENNDISYLLRNFRLLRFWQYQYPLRLWQGNAQRQKYVALCCFSVEQLFLIRQRYEFENNSQQAAHYLLSVCSTRLARSDYSRALLLCKIASCCPLSGGKNAFECLSVSFFRKNYFFFFSLQKSTTFAIKKASSPGSFVIGRSAWGVSFETASNPLSVDLAFFLLLYPVLFSILMLAESINTKTEKSKPSSYSLTNLTQPPFGLIKTLYQKGSITSGIIRKSSIVKGIWVLSFSLSTILLMLFLLTSSVHSIGLPIFVFRASNINLLYLTYPPSPLHRSAPCQVSPPFCALKRNVYNSQMIVIWLSFDNYLVILKKICNFVRESARLWGFTHIKKGATVWFTGYSLYLWNTNYLLYEWHFFNKAKASADHQAVVCWWSGKDGEFKQAGNTPVRRWKQQTRWSSAY